MQCSNCGATVREGAKLCVYCGARLGGEQGDGGRGVRDGRGPRGSSLRSYARHAGDDGDALPGQPDESAESPAYAPRPTRSTRGDDPTYRRPGRGPGRSTYDGPYDGRDDAASEQLPAAPPPARRGTGGSRSRGAEDRYDDPLDDPRAPHGLRGPAGYGGRPQDGFDGRRGERQPGVYDSPRGRTDYDNGRSRAGSRDDGYWDDGQGAGFDDRRGHERPRDDRYGRGDPRGYAPPSDHHDRRAADPLEDSWGMPAFGAGGWTDESAAWGVAPSEQYPIAPGRPLRSGQPGRRAAGQARPGGRSPTPSKSRMPLVLLLVLLAALIVGGGALLMLKGRQSLGGATSGPRSTFVAYTPGPTPTTVPNYTLFQSDRAAYILNYPKDWTPPTPPAGAGGTNDYTETFAAKAKLPFLTVERAAVFDALQDSQIVDAEVNGGKQVGESFVETGVAATVHVGGESWTRREFDVTQKDGGKVHMVILGGHHAGHGYGIVFAASPADFAGLNATTLQTVLTSFRFVG